MPLHASFWSGGNVLQPVTQRYEEQPVTPKLDTHEWKAFAHEPQESNKRPLRNVPHKRHAAGFEISCICQIHTQKPPGT